MTDLFSPLEIRNQRIKNRVVLPPLVVCGLHPDGEVTDAVVDHYEAFARGGCGLIIQEATCVTENGKLAGPQLGLWQDEQIVQHLRITRRCRPYGSVMLVQLHYASKQGEPGPVVPVGPSAYENQAGLHRELDIKEVEQIRDAFIAAAVRAEKAGYHGVELHAAHGYLLCAFMNPAINRRSDRYGQPSLLIAEIISGIRRLTGSDFLIGVRMGADNPDLASGLAMARELEQMEIDLLHVSHGMSQTGQDEIPADFPFSGLTWLGTKIKQATSLPVIAVGDLDQPGLAVKLIREGQADLAAIGRGLLVDPEWPIKVQTEKEVIPCLKCRPCTWFSRHQACPARRKEAMKQ